MKHKIITTSKARLLIVDLPDGAERIHINEFKRLLFMTPTSLHFIETKEKPPPGNWQLLGKLEEVKEIQASKLVSSLPSLLGLTRLYRDYKVKKTLVVDPYTKSTAKESLLSLLESETSLKNRLGEFPKPSIRKYGQLPGSGQQLINDVHAWQAAEEKVFHNPILLYEPI